MNIEEAIIARHSVRKYTDAPLTDEIISALNEEIGICNKEGNLNIQLVTDEPEAFSGGKLTGVKNYIALVGKEKDGLSVLCGYYGERIVLKAQMLGLNTCWVALTLSKSAVKRNIVMENDEKLVCVISLGYGQTQGVVRKSKPMEALCRADKDAPDWFISGVRAAMLAPTAINQQRFLIIFENGEPVLKDLGGFYSKIDIGIVKYHFEAVSLHSITVK